MPEVARRYRVGEDRVRGWIARGELRAVNRGDLRAARPRWPGRQKGRRHRLDADEPQEGRRHRPGRQNINLEGIVRRPGDFHGFVGQPKIVRFLRQQIEGCKALSEPCPHLLMVGASGMGKTRLAHALAEEYGTTCRVVHGRASARDLCLELVQLQKADFLFLDESHSLPREAQELLFQVIDGGDGMAAVTDHLRGEGEAKRDPQGRLLVPPVTILLATDQAGKLLQALRKRIDHTIQLLDYSEGELRAIAGNVATNLKLLVSPQALRAVANASQGQPRQAGIILKGLRRHFCVAAGDAGKQLSGGDVRKFLRSEGRDARGLDDRQRKYVEKLFRLERASLETLASLLGSDAEDTRAFVEAGLVKLDFVRIEKTGRRLTPAGVAWWEAHLAARRAEVAQKRGRRRRGGDQVRVRPEGGEPCDA
jgi:Holliday junction DNA helicase RuvB